MTQQYWILIGLVFGAVTAAAFTALTYFDPYRLRIRARLQSLQGAGSIEPAKSTISAPADSRWQAFLQYLVPRAQRVQPELNQRFARAGIYHPAAAVRFHAAKLGAMVVLISLAVTISAYFQLRTELLVLFSVIGALIGFLAPGYWLNTAIVRRHVLFSKSLPDFLDLMIVCLEGGLSLQETIRRVSDELQIAHPALALELSIVQRDIELGASIDQALKRFSARSDYEGVRSLSTFMREAQKFGTNISEALRSHAEALRDQREQAAEENAQKAAVKILIPTLILIFPAIFIVLVGPAIIQIRAAFAGN